MNTRDLLISLQDRLNKIYPEVEAKAVTSRLLEYHTKSPYSALLSGFNLEQSKIELLERAMEELLSFRPLQYVLGEAEFMGRLFHVSEGVLIPRPETEEMVWRLLQDEGPNFNGKVLDVGTGSGCIAISLALGWPKSMVYGVDYSKQALDIAHANASRLGAPISFQELDFLQSLPVSGPFDWVVSNPPYIPQEELEGMDPHVVQFEPHLALFVEDPLVFYRRLAETSPTLLVNGGRLMVEGHHAYVDKVADLFRKAGLVQVMVSNDFQGKPRFVQASKAKSPA